MSAQICDTRCFLDDCIKQSACQPFIPAGFNRLWLANKCDIESISYVTLAGDPTALIDDIVLKPGKYLYTVDFLTKTGIQFDTAVVQNASYSNENTMVVDLVTFDARSQAVMNKMLGAKLFAVAKANDDRLFAMGIGVGLEVTGRTTAHGRISTDSKLITTTWTSSDVYGQREVNFYNTGNQASDALLTEADLDALVSPLCGVY